jgi:hypothetical protein
LVGDAPLVLATLVLVPLLAGVEGRDTSGVLKGPGRRMLGTVDQSQYSKMIVVPVCLWTLAC